MTSAPGGWIELTHPLGNATPTWDDAEPLSIEAAFEIGPDHPVRVSSIRIGSHSGTHLDAPAHFIPDGRFVEDIPLDALVGPAWIADAGDAAILTESVLDSLGIPDGTRRFLVRTANTRRTLMSLPRFSRSWVGLDESGAAWLLRRGAVLFGIDYLSVQSPSSSDEVHRSLLAAGVVLVEGLDFSRPAEGLHELVCLPLLGSRLDGAPVRAIARPA